jgi:DNA-directed RNA polymerase specialized sigma24 family protein
MLVWLRYEKAWSNHELAAVLGVSVATVYRMRRVLVTQVAAHLGW